MFGRKEIVSIVEDVRNEVVGFEGNFINYFENRLNHIEGKLNHVVDVLEDSSKKGVARDKAMEQRLSRLLQNASNPQNVIKELKKSEEDSAIVVRLEEFRGEILRIHRIKNKGESLVDYDESIDKYRYTKAGEDVHEILSSTARKLSEVLGVGLTRFTNRHRHEEFCRSIGVEYVGKTEVLSIKGNGNYHTGWTTFVKEGIIDDYVDFFITKFIDVEINKRKGDD